MIRLKGSRLLVTSSLFGLSHDILSRTETAAYRVEVVELEVNGEDRTFAFAVFFNGLIEVFDITDTLYRTSTGEVQPVVSVA